MERRGEVEMKGKGKLVTHWLMAAANGAIKRRKQRKQSMAPLLQRHAENNSLSYRTSRSDML